MNLDKKINPISVKPINLEKVKGSIENMWRNPKSLPLHEMVCLITYDDGNLTVLPSLYKEGKFFSIKSNRPYNIQFVHAWMKLPEPFTHEPD